VFGFQNLHGLQFFGGAYKNIREDRRAEVRLAYVPIALVNLTPTLSNYRAQAELKIKQTREGHSPLIASLRFEKIHATLRDVMLIESNEYGVGLGTEW